ERLLAAFSVDDSPVSDDEEVLQSIAEQAGPWTLLRARQALPVLLPGLLRRAAARATGVVADDCHLQAAARAALRAALFAGRYPGRVRWV
ncbi:unnamed protein product, partial [Polarella glacialis]